MTKAPTMTAVTPSREALLALAEHHEAGCSRYQGNAAGCSMRRCLVRAGWKIGDPVDYSKATCERHETAVALRLAAKPADESDPDAMNERRAADAANMREALEPFAKVAGDYQAAYEMRLRHYGDEGHKAGPPYSDHYQISVSLGDCRKAKAALSTTGEPKR